MNLRQTLGSLPRTYLHILQRHGCRDSLRFVADYVHVRTLIRNRLATTINTYHNANLGVGAHKYLDTDYWIHECLRRAYMLDLHRSTTVKAVLDLGSGAGYFTYLCNYYGHRAEALDVPDNDLYTRIVQDLGISRYADYIQPCTDLPTAQRYDLVTAFMICFNDHKTPQPWHIKEWDYFIDSVLRRNLLPGGRILLSFNSETPDEPVSPALLEFFAGNQATVMRKGSVSSLGLVEVAIDQGRWQATGTSV
jgi:SAM-dependent methyltransferase